MMQERRNDIGTKVLIAVISLLITVIMAFSIVSASSAVAQATANAIDLSYMKASYASMKDDVSEIKLDVRKLLTIVRD